MSFRRINMHFVVARQLQRVQRCAFLAPRIACLCDANTRTVLFQQPVNEAQVPHGISDAVLIEVRRPAVQIDEGNRLDEILSLQILEDPIPVSLLFAKRALSLYPRLSSDIIRVGTVGTQEQT